MDCLDESTVLALVQGGLRDSEAKERRRHLASCDACRALVGAVARSFRTGDGGPASATELANTDAVLGSSATAPAKDDDVLDHLDDRAFMERVATGTLLDGRYRVERVLGAGGMGVVALATHVALGQLVAIKLLHPRSLASAEVVARFVREAQAAVRVASEHVVRVLDVATLPSGEPYIAMEYLVGRDARAHLAERKTLTVADVVDLVAQACLGVGRAHRAGIVHRDLKPANLFVLDAPDREVPFLVKVLDFGVSKVRRDEIGAGEASLTRSTAFLGTPLYMSPEQIRASRDVDARADVWALGCILHELLVGKAPFRRESLGLTCAAILVEEPEPIARTRNDVPKPIEAIVARCLAKDRAARFADGFDLAVALAPFASSTTRDEIVRVVGVDARPTAPPRPTSRLRALALVAAVPVLAIGAFVALRPPERAPASASQAPSANQAPSASQAPPSANVPEASAPAGPSVAASLPATSAHVPTLGHPLSPPKPLVPAPTSAAAPSSTPPAASSGIAVPSAAPAPPPAPSPSAPLNPEFGARK